MPLNGFSDTVIKLAINVGQAFQQTNSLRTYACVPIAGQDIAVMTTA